MKENLNKRTKALLTAVGLIMVTVVGATLAYIIVHTADLNNQFVPARVSCAVYETVNGSSESGTSDTVADVETKKDVSIKNTGNTVAYIRAKVVITWKNDDGSVHAKPPVENMDYTLQMPATSKWFVASDDFWYFTVPVHPDEFTDALIAGCQLSDSAFVPEGYHLSVEIVASAVQATKDAVEQWSDAVTAASNGADLTKKQS